jgi:hypothetical protein
MSGVVAAATTCLAAAVVVVVVASATDAAARRLSLFCLCLDLFVLGDLDRRDRQARAWLPGEPIVCASGGKAKLTH